MNAIESLAVAASEVGIELAIFVGVALAICAGAALVDWWRARREQR